MSCPTFTYETCTIHFGCNSQARLDIWTSCSWAGITRVPNSKRFCSIDAQKCFPARKRTRFWHTAFVCDWLCSFSYNVTPLEWDKSFTWTKSPAVCVIFFIVSQTLVTIAKTHRFAGNTWNFSLNFQSCPFKRGKSLPTWELSLWQKAELVAIETDCFAPHSPLHVLALPHETKQAVLHMSHMDLNSTRYVTMAN